MLNPVEVLTGILQWVGQQAGLAGVGVGVGGVVTAGLWLWWGVKLRLAISVLGTVLRNAGQHALVSTVVVASVVGGMLWAGVIPGINVNVLLDILARGASVSVETILGVVG